MVLTDIFFSVPVIAIFTKFDDLVVQVHKLGSTVKKSRKVANHELQAKFQGPLSQSKFPPRAYVRLESMLSSFFDDGSNDEHLRSH